MIKEAVENINLHVLEDRINIIILRLDWIVNRIDHLEHYPLYWSGCLLFIVVIISINSSKTEQGKWEVVRPDMSRFWSKSSTN